MKRTFAIFLLGFVLLLVSFFLQILYGSVSIPLKEVLAILFNDGSYENQVWRTIIMDSRLPGALAAVLAGAGLSVSGLQMQTLFRNPVAGPFVLGISAGASLGVACLILAGSAMGLSMHQGWFSSSGIIIAAAIGAFAVFLLNFFISYRVADVVALLIIGLMIGGGINAFIEILQSLSSGAALKNYVIWMMGSFRYVNLTQVKWLAFITIPGLVFSWMLSKPLNLLLLGDTYAQSLGLNIRWAKLMSVLCTSILAGTVTAFCGPVGFVGLAVPHVARALFKTADHKLLTPACALLGAIICCLCNLVAASPGSEFVLPISAVTSLLGAPVVIWIIIRQRRVV